MASRASILAWSAGSGALLGLVIDLSLLGVWVVVSAVWPTAASRPIPRWLATIAILGMTAIPILSAVLGYLEGRLKID